MPREPLPIDDALPALLAAFRDRGAVVLRAPTGAGKTTRVPPAIVEGGIAGDGLVVMLEPRRVAARAAARRMAIEHGTPLGEVFGYQVRFDRKAGPRTRVLVVTPGVLLRFLHDNPFLDGIAAVVFDEFHERGLEADLALGMVRLVRENVRPDLKVVVMSATVEPGPVSAHLGGCPVVDSAGRAFPVEIKYRARRSDTAVSLAVADAIRDALRETDGDVLAFLPGLREIRQTADELAGVEAEVLPLHGDLPPEQQDRALSKLDRRKVVLATNVAETSVTVEGVCAVVDSGLARQMEFEPSSAGRSSCRSRRDRAPVRGPHATWRAHPVWDGQARAARTDRGNPPRRSRRCCNPRLGEADIAKFPCLSLRPESLAERCDFDQLGL